MRLNYNYRNERGEFAPYVLTVGDRKVINPSAEVLAEAGYLPYTAPQPSEEELSEQSRLAEIETLKAQLAESDYKAIKYAEGWYTAAEYAPIKAERQSLRVRINELEGEP